MCPAKHELGESAEKEEDAVPPICVIEVRRPLDCRRCFPGATEEGGVVAAEPMGRGEPSIDPQGFTESRSRVFQLSRCGVQHALDTFCPGVPRFAFECKRDRLAAKVGCRCGGARISPPGIADEMLASARDTKERIEIAWIASKRGKKSFLSLGAEVGAQLSREDCLGPRKTLVETKLRLRCDAGAAARFLQEQRIKHPRDLADCLRLDCGDLFKPALPPIRPQVIGRHSV